MLDILSEKIKQLEQSKDFECWYLVKQSVDFTSLCYKVYFLDSYKKTDKSKNIESYINDSIDSLNKSNPSLNIEKNYRQLRIAAFFGLIEMKSSFKLFLQIIYEKTFDYTCMHIKQKKFA